MAAPEIDGLAVVLIGNFNPAIVQPAWLARHGLVRDAEANEAAIELIRPEFTSFKVGPFSVRAEQERFQLDVSDVGLAAPLRDLCVGLFTILAETPVRKVGLNRLMHFRMPDEAGWHRVGNVLAPKEFWTAEMNAPGMASLTIFGKRPAAPSERVQVTVEPSTKITPGVFVAINEQLDVETQRAADAITLVQLHFESMIDYAGAMGNRLVALGGTE